MDILVVGDPAERYAVEIRKAFRYWQVYSLTAPGALWARRFRRAYYTDGAETHANFERMVEVLRSKGEVRHLSTYAPDAPVDYQTWEDAKLLREIRRSRFPSS